MIPRFRVGPVSLVEGGDRGLKDVQVTTWSIRLGVVHARPALSRVGRDLQLRKRREKLVPRIVELA